jgi:hypothetical protein
MNMAVTYGPFYIWLGGGFNHLEVIKCKLQFPCKTTAQIRVALYVQICTFANRSDFAFRAPPPLHLNCAILKFFVYGKN